jgi:hypothetical protein
MLCQCSSYAAEFPNETKEVDGLVKGTVEYFSDATVCINCTRWDEDVESILTWRDESIVRGEHARDYLVKWIGCSHLHNTWVPEDYVSAISRAKLRNFLKRVEEDEESSRRRTVWPKEMSDVVEEGSTI